MNIGACPSTEGLPLIHVAAEIKYGDLNDVPLFGADHHVIIPIFMGAAPGNDWFCAAKPILSFEVATDRSAGAVLRVMLSPYGAAIPVLWREWYVPGGDNAGGVIPCCEYGLPVPSWELQVHFYNLDPAAGGFCQAFVSMRAM